MVVQKKLQVACSACEPQISAFVACLPQSVHVQQSPSHHECAYSAACGCCDPRAATLQTDLTDHARTGSLLLLLAPTGCVHSLRHCVLPASRAPVPTLNLVPIYGLNYSRCPPSAVVASVLSVTAPPPLREYTCPWPVDTVPRQPSAVAYPPQHAPSMHPTSISLTLSVSSP